MKVKIFFFLTRARFHHVIPSDICGLLVKAITQDDGTVLEDGLTCAALRTAGDLVVAQQYVEAVAAREAEERPARGTGVIGETASGRGQAKRGQARNHGIVRNLVEMVGRVGNQSMTSRQSQRIRQLKVVQDRPTAGKPPNNGQLSSRRRQGPVVRIPLKVPQREGRRVPLV